MKKQDLVVYVRLHLFSSEQGGRQQEIRTGYRPSFWFGEYINDQRAYYDAHLFLTEVQHLAPGEEAHATIRPHSPEYWGDVKPGMILHVCEGPRLIGNAVVESITLSE